MKTIYNIILVLFCCTASVWGQATLDVKAVQCDGTLNGKLVVKVSNIPYGEYPVHVTAIRTGTSSITMSGDIFDENDPLIFDNIPPNNTPITISATLNSNTLIGSVSRTISTTFRRIDFDEDPIQDVDCPDKGKITINVKSGTPPYKYILESSDPFYNNNHTGADNENFYTFENLPRDNIYEVYLEDVNGCAALVSSTINFDNYTPLELIIAPADVHDISCTGEDDGYVIFSLIGGASGEDNNVIYPTFVLNDDEDETNETLGLSFSNLYRANNTLSDPEFKFHYITVYDLAGCEDVVAFEIFEPTPSEARIVLPLVPPCVDESNGAIKVERTPDSGTPGYKFNISPNPNNETADKTGVGDVVNFTGLNAATAGTTYTVTGTDGNGCAFTPVSAKLEPQPEPTFTITKTHPECYDESNGRIDVTPVQYSALEMEYSLDGSSWQTPPYFENLPSGTYAVFGRKGGEYGCTWEYPDPVILLDPEEVTVTVVTARNVSCRNGDDGSINFSISGGELSDGKKYNYKYGYKYRYSDDGGDTWIDGGFTDLNSISSDIIYTGTIPEQSRIYEITGQVIKREIEMEIPWLILGPDYPPCESQPELVTIYQPLPLAVNNIATTKATCPATSDGTITFNVTGGNYPESTATYSYSTLLSETPNSTNSSPVFYASPGNYNITVTYSNNSVSCTGDVVSATVEYAATITANITPSSPVNATCNTEAGNITITANVITQEGNGWDLEYYIDDVINAGATPNVFNNLGVEGASTSYGVIIKYAKDTNGDCKYTSTHTVIVPALITFTADVTSEITCNGANNGEITVTADPATGYQNASAYFSFSIDNGATWEAELPGSYVHVFDDLEPNPAYKIKVKKIYGASECVGYDEDNLTSQIIELELTEPDEIVITAGSSTNPNPLITDVSCPDLMNNLPNGTITVNATAGEQTLTFELLDEYKAPTGIPNTTPSTDNGTFEDLEAGDYFVRVSTVATCYQDVPATVNRPVVITIDPLPAIPELVPCSTAEASVILTVTSSDPGPFVYRLKEGSGSFGNWIDFPNNSNTTTIMAGIGSYEAEVAYKDKEDCLNHTTGTFEVELDTSLGITITGAIKNNCNGGDEGTITINSNLPIGTNYQLFYSETGNEPWTISRTFNSTATNMPRTYSDLLGGYYKVVGNVSDGVCPQYESEIEDLTDIYDALEVTILSIANPCSEDNANGEISIEVSGGAGGYTFELNTKNLGPGYTTRYSNKVGKFINLPIQTYYIYVYDALGCNTGFLPPNGLDIFTYPDEFKFNEDDDVISPVNCNGSNDGKAIIAVEGGREFNSYEWNDIEEKFEKISGGRQKCTYVWEQIEGTGWNTSHFEDSMAYNMTAGKYRITVTDNCGVQIFKEVIIYEPDELVITSLEATGGITCDGDPDGTITVKTAGGTPKETPDGTPPSYYDYTVFKESVEITIPSANIQIVYDDDAKTETFGISGLDDGDYRIEVTDNVCTPASVTESITNPLALDVKTTKKDVKCNNDPDGGAIRVAIIGGNEPFTITLLDTEGNIATDIDGAECKFEGIDKTSPFITIISGIAGDSIVLTFNKLFGGSGTGAERTKYYAVVVEEEKIDGCDKKIENIGILNPRTLSVTLNTIDESDNDYKNFICVGVVSDIYLSTEVRGEQGNYTTEWWIYNIDDFYPNPTFNNSFPAPAGEYYVIVNDGICPPAKSNTITIYQYEALSADYEMSDVSCEQQGAIRITDAAGGIKTTDLAEGEENVYWYRVWDVDAGSYLSGFDTFKAWKDDNIVGLAEGKYRVEMKHGEIDESCVPPVWIPSSTGEITIDKSFSFDINEFTIDDKDDPDCFNTDEGKIVIAVPVHYAAGEDNGNFAYNFNNWDDKATIWEDIDELETELEFSDLKAGIFSLYIKDRLTGCIDSVHIEIGASLPRIAITNISDYNSACGDVNGGFIDITVEIYDPAKDFTAVAPFDDILVNCSNTTNGTAEFYGTPEFDDATETWTGVFRAYIKDEGEAIVAAVLSNGCSTDEQKSNNIVFTGELALDYEITPIAATVKCSEVENREVTFTFGGGDGDYTFSIFDESDNPVLDGEYLGNVTEYVTELEAGKYTFKLYDGEGCERIIDKESEDAKPIELPKKVELAEPRITPATCDGKSNGSIRLSPETPDLLNPYNYLWHENNPIGGGSTADRLENNLSASIYMVTVSNADGSCPEDFEIEVPNYVYIDIVLDSDGSGENKNEYCPGVPVNLVGTVTVTDNRDDDFKNTDIRIRWLPSDIVFNAPEPENTYYYVLPDDAKSVSLQVDYIRNFNNSWECSASVLFEKIELEEPDISALPDEIFISDLAESYTLDLENIPVWQSYNWNISDNGIPVAPNQPFPVYLTPPVNPYTLTLTITGEGEVGCTASHDITVKPAITLEIPNAFTPNGDEFNDYWYFRNIEQYTDLFNINVKVFNRSGILMFEHPAYNDGVAWNGQRNQNAVPIATYYYVVQIIPKSGTKGNSRVLTGTVIIMR